MRSHKYLKQRVADPYAKDIISDDPRTQHAYEMYCIWRRDEPFVYKYPCYKWSREDD